MADAIAVRIKPLSVLREVTQHYQARLQLQCRQDAAFEQHIREVGARTRALACHFGDRFAMTLQGHMMRAVAISG